MNISSRIIVTAVAVSTGIIILAGYFFAPFQGLSYLMLRWTAVMLAFALFLGLINLFRVHFNQIKTRQKSWFYSAILIITLAITLIVGREGPNSAGGQNLFEYVLRPLESTMFALLAFFIAAAAYRAFRIKNFETFLLVAFAIIVLLGQVPAGFQLWPDLPLVKEWIVRVPALAGARGILLGAALGIIATGLRILVGADRPYAGTE